MDINATVTEIVDRVRDYRKNGFEFDFYLTEKIDEILNMPGDDDMLKLYNINAMVAATHDVVMMMAMCMEMGLTEGDDPKVIAESKQAISWDTFFVSMMHEYGTETLAALDAEKNRRAANAGS